MSAVPPSSNELTSAASGDSGAGSSNSGNNTVKGTTSSSAVTGGDSSGATTIGTQNLFVATNKTSNSSTATKASRNSGNNISPTMDILRTPSADPSTNTSSRSVASSEPGLRVSRQPQQQPSPEKQQGLPSSVPNSPQLSPQPSTPVTDVASAPQLKPHHLAGFPRPNPVPPTPPFPQRQQQNPSHNPEQHQQSSSMDDDEHTEQSSAGNTAAEQGPGSEDGSGSTNQAPSHTEINTNDSVSNENNSSTNNMNNTGNFSFVRLWETTKRRLGNNRNNTSNNETNRSRDDSSDLAEDALLGGYLQKLGRNGKWQTRWFETDGECLSYYKTSKRNKLLATLDLAKVGEINIDLKDSKGCSFSIQVLGRLYHLRADSRASCKDWVITLNRIKEARLQQGNVKLVNMQQPIDLLDQNDEIVAPRVVVVANRPRARAVDETQEWDQLIRVDENPADQPGEPPAFEVKMKRHSTLSAVVLARWTKRKSSFAHLRAKLAKWARSLRRYNCASEEGAQLDRHVHPPGHDDQRSRSASSDSTNKKAQASFAKVVCDGRAEAPSITSVNVPDDYTRTLS